MTDAPIDSQLPARPDGRAPADAIPRAPWPLSGKITAYVLLSAVAIAAIGYVDRKVHLPSAMPPTTSPSMRNT